MIDTLEPTDLKIVRIIVLNTNGKSFVRKSKVFVFFRLFFTHHSKELLEVKFNVSERYWGEELIQPDNRSEDP